MADVFVSYKREDRGRTEVFADRLRNLGLDVWFDARLSAGESFDSEIEREVRAAKAVLVLWSKGSVDSRWVRNEASLGLEERKLAAVQIEPCQIPLAFRDIHYETLHEVNFEQDAPSWQKLCQRLEYLTGKSISNGSTSATPVDEGVQLAKTARQKTPLPLDIEFSPQEHWAWGRISRGEVADLAYYPNDTPDGGSTDPNASESWPPHRALSEKFLRVVLLLDPWASVSESPRVVVANAIFADPIRWAGRLSRRNFQLLNCVFSDEFELTDFTAQSGMSLRGSHIRKSFVATRIECAAPLDLSATVFHDAADMQNARVNGDLLLARASFNSDVLISHAQVSGSLLLREASVGGTAWIEKSQIRDDIDAASTTFSSDVRLGGAQVGGDIAFYSVSCASDLSAPDIQVGGAVTLRGGTLSGRVILDRAKVGGDIRIDEATARADWLLIRMRVSGDVLLSGSRVDSTIDLSGSEIQGEIVLGQRGREVAWGDRALLVLRNAAAGALVVHPSGLAGSDKSKWLRADLRGFSYQRLSSVFGEVGDSLLDVPPRRIGAWISAQSTNREFEPQPFREMARNLSRADRERNSIAVLRAMLNQKRRARSTPLLEKFGLMLSEQLIGYGYSPVRALVLFPILIGLGALAGLVGIDGANARAFIGPDAGRVAEWALFSIQNAVPGLGGERSTTQWLEEQIAASRGPSGLLVYWKWLFLAHRIVGFVIVAYLVAAVSGLATRDQK